MTEILKDDININLTPELQELYSKGIDKHSKSFMKLLERLSTLTFLNSTTLTEKYLKVYEIIGNSLDDESTKLRNQISSFTSELVGTLGLKVIEGFKYFIPDTKVFNSLLQFDFMESFYKQYPKEFIRLVDINGAVLIPKSELGEIPVDKLSRYATFILDTPIILTHIIKYYRIWKNLSVQSESYYPIFNYIKKIIPTHPLISRVESIVNIKEM